MRKLILTSVVILLCAACDPYLSRYHSGTWFIKNCTDQTLTISFPPHHRVWENRDVAAGDSVSIHYCEFEWKSKVIPYFDRFLEDIAYYGDENISLDVLSEQGELLKRWRYLDKDLPGKQFFNESPWHYSQYHNKLDKVRITAKWVFEILPEDLIGEKDE